MSELPDPVILTEDELLALFAGGQPEQLAIRNLIHTFFSTISGLTGLSTPDNTDTAESLTFTTGTATDNDGDGGDFIVNLGAGDGTGRDGLLVLTLTNFPTADPLIAGAVYADGAPTGGTPKALKISGGA